MVSFGSLASKIFGDSNDRLLKAYEPRVDEINALEAEIEKLSDEELRARTEDFKKQVKDGAELKDLLVPAFATVREAAKRTLGQRHFDVQLVGGMVLHDGQIAEMKTGEGKTLVATLPVYLNALEGKGVHVVTVNDYLAKRDSEWMGEIYKFLGLSVGVIVHDLDDSTRQAQYACDVTYGTNNEFGFDYLRDNMKYNMDEMVQREHHYAIVDEVDSILIDEARTPLIISGAVEDRTDLYNAVDLVIPDLVEADYEVDEKVKATSFTEEGNEHIEELLETAGLLQGNSLYDVENVTIVHHINQALRAHKLFQKDRDYIVKNDQVVIIDEFTGRMMEGRRYSEGLHQALEAKEHVAIQPENQTLASITFQNYFRLYHKLAGMTGTALTEAGEFQDIYGLGVLDVPTNEPVDRTDEDDEVYRTAGEKYRAIVEQILDCRKRGQPMLVGTTSIEKSELLSAKLGDKKFLKELGINKKIPHKVLNARYHEEEAMIIAQAGVPGAITIATNMAGRGTDIQLGGNLDMRIAEETGDIDDEAQRDRKIEEIKADVANKRKKALEGGGLYVVGTERHESRRIDNQLRGRSGRQGDPGRSKFYLSLEDDLMRIFGSERMDGMLQKLGLEEGEAIIHPWINKALEKAQSKVEARNFDIRKNLLKYDDVMNDQRKVIFAERIDLMRDEDVSETVSDMRHQLVDDLVARHIPEKAFAEQWDTEGLKKDIAEIFDLDLPVDAWAKEEGIADEEIRDRLESEVNKQAASREAKAAIETGRDVMDHFEEARQMAAFVDGNEELKALVGHAMETAPAEEGPIGIGMFLMEEDDRQKLRKKGVAVVEQEAYNIGVAFLQQYGQSMGLIDLVAQAPEQSPSGVGRLFTRRAEKSVLLQTLDSLWREHLVTLEHLRQVVGLRGYGQRDPLNEYKTESFTLFEGLLDRLREEVTKQLSRLSFEAEEPAMEMAELPEMEAHHVDPFTGEDDFALSDGGVDGAARPAPMRSRMSASEMNPEDPASWGKVPRNAPCPCGSGKKYKHCHGRLN